MTTSPGPNPPLVTTVPVQVREREGVARAWVDDLHRQLGREHANVDAPSGDRERLHRLGRATTGKRNLNQGLPGAAKKLAGVGSAAYQASGAGAAAIRFTVGKYITLISLNAIRAQPQSHAPAHSPGKGDRGQALEKSVGPRHRGAGPNRSAGQLGLLALGPRQALGEGCVWFPPAGVTGRVSGGRFGDEPRSVVQPDRMLHFPAQCRTTAHPSPCRARLGRNRIAGDRREFRRGQRRCAQPALRPSA